MIRRVAAIVTLVISVGALVLAVWMLGGGPDRASSGACSPGPPEELTVEVLAAHPHDPDAFTQGLLVDPDGELWESTGLRGHSELRRVDVETGEVIDSATLDSDLFGEGLTRAADGRLVQLTWTAGRALRWDPESLEVAGEFRYEGEGWGITTLDDDFHAMSDGSNRLRFRSPGDFEVVGEMEVERRGGSADRLNELEWDGEALWANRYQSSEILRIDLDCGTVDGVVDASGLVDRAQERIGELRLERDLESRDVLNGIAWAGPGSPDRYYVTGKRWPVLFEVTFTDV